MLYRKFGDSNVYMCYDRKVNKYKVRCTDLDNKTIAKFICKADTRLDLYDLSSIKWVIKDGIRAERYIPSDTVTITVASS